MCGYHIEHTTVKQFLSQIAYIHTAILNGNTNRNWLLPKCQFLPRTLKWYVTRRCTLLLLGNWVPLLVVILSFVTSRQECQQRVTPLICNLKDAGLNTSFITWRLLFHRFPYVEKLWSNQSNGLWENDLG